SISAHPPACPRKGPAPFRGRDLSTGPCLLESEGRVQDSESSLPLPKWKAFQAIQSEGECAWAWPGLQRPRSPGGSARHEPRSARWRRLRAWARFTRLAGGEPEG